MVSKTPILYDDWDEDVATELWNRVMAKTVETKNGCWEYQGAKLQGGYCQIHVTREAGKVSLLYAHRLVYCLYHCIPFDHLQRQVNHKCHNPCCVNPDHLYNGNQSQNIKDCYELDRGGLAKLTVRQVQEIRRLRDTGKYTQKRLARKFGVCSATIANICNRRTWSRV